MKYVKLLCFALAFIIDCACALPCLAQQGSLADIHQEDGVEDTYYAKSHCLHECMRQPSITASFLAACTAGDFGQCKLLAAGVSSEACGEWVNKLANTPIAELGAPSITGNPLYLQCAREARQLRDKHRNLCLTTCPSFYEETGSREALGLLNTINAIEHDDFRLYGSYTTDLRSLINFNLQQLPHSYAYKVGFVHPYGGIVHRVPEAMNSDWFLQQGAYSLPLDANVRKIPFSTMEQYCPDCTATQNTFKAVAFTDLFGDGNLDIWTIDQTGNAMHVKDGLTHLSPPATPPFQPMHTCELNVLNIVIGEHAETTRGNSDYQYKLQVNNFVPNGAQPLNMRNDIVNDLNYYGHLFDADITIVSGGTDKRSVIPMGQTLEIGDIIVRYNGIYASNNARGKVGNFTMQCRGK